jgi:hypothetical protein
MKTTKKLPNNFTWISLLFNGYLPTDPMNAAELFKKGRIRRFNEPNLSIEVKYQDGKWYTADIVANSGKSSVLLVGICSTYYVLILSFLLIVLFMYSRVQNST